MIETDVQRYYRMIGHPDARYPFHYANGRKYTAPSPGTYLDVPDFDGKVLEAQGWTILNGGPYPIRMGTTAQRPNVTPSPDLRPVFANKGELYLDLTLGKLIVCTGGDPINRYSQWVDVLTGAAV
jgi:hypothetical protein